ncbi:hypothetical protein [Kitasatospora sp. NPDC057223]|uniref:hypothetical protein n=1 Tax=Kitasatospora sp. NPDC057223 TaxID=3346055 RepID=UPI003627AAF9
MDLTTPQGLRGLLVLCLDGRRKRTPAKLASVMPPYMVKALQEHAPDVAAARAAARQAQLAADRAQRAYVKKLEAWIRTPGTTVEAIDLLAVKG